MGRRLISSQSACRPISSVLRSESYQQLEVVAGGGVAMEVYAAGVLQDSVKFDHALRHHGQVGHHVVVAEEGAHGLEEVGELTGGVGYKILIGALRFKTPGPGVLEGGNLGGGLLACLLLEEDVVVGVGVEGRVKIDEVNAGVGDVVAQDVEVVAEVELVLPVGGGHWWPALMYIELGSHTIVQDLPDTLCPRLARWSDGTSPTSKCLWHAAGR